MEKVRKIKIKLDSVSNLEDPDTSMNNIKKSFSDMSKIKNSMRKFIEKKDYAKADPETQNLILLLSDTNERIDLMGDVLNHFYGFLRTALMAQFHSVEQLHNAIDELKKDPTNKETLSKIDSLRKEQSNLHEKYDKIEPIVNGLDEIVEDRKKSIMEN